MSLIQQNYPNSNENTKNSESYTFSRRRSSIKWVEKLNQRRSTIKRSQIKIELDSVDDMIAKAKIHQRANKPLIKIKEFDGNTKFCQCCYLPAEDDKYLRKSNFCENTDKFAAYGRGTSLFFSYYRFSIFILAFALCLMALPSFLLTNYYTNQLIDTCGKIYEKENQAITESFPDCINFINTKNVSEYLIEKGDWEFKFNGMNLKYYRIVYKNIVGKDDFVNKVLTNYHIISFITLVTLFIINLLYIILLYNINHQYDLSVTSPGDFTIIISNLHSAFKVFWKNIIKINTIIKAEINNQKNNRQTLNEEQDSNLNFGACKEEIEILGLQDFPKDKEINIFEGFNHFLKKKICTNSKGDEFNIYRINICYKINEFMKIEEEIQELKKKIYKIKHQKYQIKKNERLNLSKDDRRYFYNPGFDFCNCGICENFQILSDIKKEKENLESQLKGLLSQTENLTEENFSGVVFVTFNNIGEKEKILEPYPKNVIMTIFVWIKNLKYFLCCCCVSKSERDQFFLKRNVRIKEAPEPEDVIFENLQYSAFERLFRTILVYFLSLIMIFVCFIIILFLNDFQIKKLKNNSNNFVIKYGISISITLIISILNTIFQFILEYLTKKEKQYCNTDYYLSFSIKLTIFTFLTSGIIPLISSYYHSKSKYDLLLANMLTLFLSNSFLTPIWWSLNFQFFKKKLKICLIKDNFENYTQDELNKIYELLDMKVSYKYSYISKTLLMSFLYMPIFPMSIAISFFGFIFGYLLEKFNFSRMYKRPEMLNSKICEFYSNYFIINFFMLCLGNYIFLRDNNQSNIWSISNLIIFGVLIIIPYNQIFVCDFIGIKESVLKVDKEYEDYSFIFFNDYEKINPMTKIEAIKRFLDNLKSNALITEEDSNIIMKNIDKVNLMETYYKARKKFAESLLIKAFMNIPETNDKIKKGNKVAFIEKLKQYSKNKKMNIINLLLSHINQNNNPNLNYINNNLDESNSNLISNKTSQKNKKNNSVINFGNELKGQIDSINANSMGNNIHINININISNGENEDTANKNTQRKTSLSKKNMDIFKYLVKREQKKILNYYRNPVLFIIKQMCEGIIFHNNDEKEDKNKLSDIEEINIDENKNEDNSSEKNSIDEHINKIQNKENKKKKKIKIKVKKKIKIKKKIKKKNKKTVENMFMDEVNGSSSFG